MTKCTGQSGVKLRHKDRKERGLGDLGGRTARTKALVGKWHVCKELPILLGFRREGTAQPQYRLDICRLFAEATREWLGSGSAPSFPALRTHSVIESTALLSSEHRAGTELSPPPPSPQNAISPVRKKQSTDSGQPC